MRAHKLLARLSNSQTNVHFPDFVAVIEAVGFARKGGRGSHRVYAHPQVVEVLNIQNDRGQAKPYQIRQFLRYVEDYDLRIDG